MRFYAGDASNVQGATAEAVALRRVATVRYTGRGGATALREAQARILAVEGGTLLVQVGLCSIQNDEFCINHDGFCIQNDAIRIQNAEPRHDFRCTATTDPVPRWWQCLSAGQCRNQDSSIEYRASSLEK